MKSFLEKKSAGCYLILISSILALISLVIYGSGTASFTVAPVIAGYVLAVLFGIVVIVKPVPCLEFLVLIFQLVALGALIRTEAEYISSVLYGIDGAPMTTAYLAMFVLTCLATLISALTPIFRQTKE